MRQLLIATDAAVAYTNGLLANGAVDVQKRDANGQITSLAAGDTIGDAADIRFCQGTTGENIVTPWISGKNMVVWSGKEYSAQVAKVLRWTVGAAATGNGDIVIKLINAETDPHEVFVISTYIDFDGGTTTQANIIDAIEAQCTELQNDGSWPEWLSTTVSNSGGATIDFTGAIDGDTTISGATWDGGAVNILAADDASDVAGVGQANWTYAVQTALQKGTGDGVPVGKFEESLQGSGVGYYNRIHLPNAPTKYAVAATNYDMYTIVATKDGSTSPQIKGVDNLIEIYVAIPLGNANGIAFEGQMNPYAVSTPLTFNQVVL